MPILFKDGMPYQIPESEVITALKAGFRRPPESPAAGIPSPTVLTANGDPTADGVNVNTATSKQLIALPEIGIATAKVIVKNRPYQSLQDLKEKVGGEVDWDAIAERLTY